MTAASNKMEIDKKRTTARSRKRRGTRAANKLADCLSGLGLTESATAKPKSSSLVARKKRRTKIKKKNNINDEQAEFDRAYKSLTEREQNVLAQSAKEKRRQRRFNKTKSKKERRAIRMGKAILGGDSDKTTAQLMNEATERVGRMEGIGEQQQQQISWTRSSTSLFSTGLAPPSFAVRNPLMAPATVGTELIVRPQQQTNPFLVLQNGSDDEGGKNSAAARPPEFSFAPASFQVAQVPPPPPPTASTPPVQNPEDIDPDL